MNKFKVGDLVRIDEKYLPTEDRYTKWVGVILSYRGLGLGDEPEWMVQWAHQPYEAVEYGYYLEVI